MKLEVEGLLGQVFHPRPQTAYFLIAERTVFNFMPILVDSLVLAKQQYLSEFHRSDPIFSRKLQAK